jgi:hypothetical protein
MESQQGQRVVRPKRWSEMSYGEKEQVQTEHLIARPDICPKGHRIWWFVENSPADRPISWGICAGKRVADRIQVVGACREVWIFRAGHLGNVPKFNPTTLVRVMREQAWMLGTFLPSVEEEPFIVAAGGSTSRTLEVEDSPLDLEDESAE